MKKQVIRLTESDLHKIVENSVRRIMTENEEDEGLWNNMKSAFKGARNGYQTQKALDTDNNNYTRNSRVSPNEAPSNDAAESVRQYYQIAKEYLTKYNQMKAKADKLAKQYGIKSVGQGMNKNFDYDVSGEFKGNTPNISGRHDNYASNQVRNGNNKRQGTGKW